MPLRIITGTVALATLLSLWLSFALAHEETLRVSRVVRVVDGDGIVVDIDGLPAVFGQALGIRLRGINTPEIRTSHACEKVRGFAAREALVAFIEGAQVLMLTDMGRDKFFRIDATLMVDGRSANAHMLATGHARPYSGDTAREPWVCEEGGK